MDIYQSLQISFFLLVFYLSFIVFYFSFANQLKIRCEMFYIT